MTQGEGVIRGAGLDGVQRLYAYTLLSQSPTVGFAHVAVGIPTGVAFGELNRLAVRNLIGLAIIALLALGAAWVGSDALVLRPVNALVRASGRLRAGDFTARTGAAAVGGEIGQLTRTFDEMAEALQQREDRLLEIDEQLRGALADSQSRLGRLRALRAVDIAILGNLDLRKTLTIIVAKVIGELHVHAADILLLDGAGEALECVAARGFRSPILQRPRLWVGEGHAGRAAVERVPIMVADLAAEPDEPVAAASLRGEGFVAYYAVPLVAQDKVKGVLELFHRSPMIVNQEWSDFLEAMAGQAAIAVDNALLFDQLERANADLALAYDETLEGWSRALDLRDRETEGHTLRVTEVTLRLAEAMGVAPGPLLHIRRGALLHDIGKMGIPDQILLKPASLTRDEWDIMRKHPTYAYELLSPISYLRPALDIPYAHHEKWDGTGYPRGLAGEDIPLAARIFAVVDTWDALRSDRPYRHGWADDRVVAYLQERAGKDFDPAVVAAFLHILEREGPEPAARASRL
jgi:putative nucleotidyltransferase with HDIG domain